MYNPVWLILFLPIAAVSQQNAIKQTTGHRPLMFGVVKYGRIMTLSTYEHNYSAITVQNNVI